MIFGLFVAKFSTLFIFMMQILYLVYDFWN